MANELIIATGGRGTGKTTLASTYYTPSKAHLVYYHDAEDSANRVVDDMKEQELHFGRYVALTDRFKNLLGDDDLLTRINRGELPWVNAGGKASLLEFYEYVLDDLNTNLEKDKYEVYVMDTLEKFEAGMTAWVDDNRRKTGALGGPGGKDGAAYGQFWWGALYPLYEGFFGALYARGIKTIIMTSHLKQAWETNKAVPGKVKASGKSILYKRSILFLWLVNEIKNPNGEPAALVLKERMGKLVADKVNDVWKPRRMLPYRIPCFTWEAVKEYRNNGADLLHPQPGEMRSQKEEEMISEFLSDIQMQLMVAQQAAETAEYEARNQPVQTRQGTMTIHQSIPGTQHEMPDVKGMHEKGKSIEEIAAETGLNPVVVRVILN